MIVLGSTSKYRAELLSRLQLPFSTAKPVCDETPHPAELPKTLANRLAQTKAQSLLDAHPNDIIIGSDQVASLGTSVIGKPGSVDMAKQQLQRMQGQSVVFHTAICVLDGVSGNCLNEIDETTVWLRTLNAAEIERYIAADNPIDCAGSFKVEQLGISLFERVVSDDPTALVGLPLIKLSQCLRQLGVVVP